MDRISDLRTPSNPRCQPANKRFLSHLNAFYLAHNDINVNSTLQLSLICLRNHLDKEVASNILVEGRPRSPLVSGFLNLFPVLEKKSCPLSTYFPHPPHSSCCRLALPASLGSSKLYWTAHSQSSSCMRDNYRFCHHSHKKNKRKKKREIACTFASLKWIRIWRPSCLLPHLPSVLSKIFQHRKCCGKPRKYRSFLSCPLFVSLQPIMQGL